MVEEEAEEEEGCEVEETDLLGSAPLINRGISFY